MGSFDEDEFNQILEKSRVTGYEQEKQDQVIFMNIDFVWPTK